MFSFRFKTVLVDVIAKEKNKKESILLIMSAPAQRESLRSSGDGSRAEYAILQLNESSYILRYVRRELMGVGWALFYFMVAGAR